MFKQKHHPDRMVFLFDTMLPPREVGAQNAVRYYVCMSWAGRRRFVYGFGVFLFFAILIGVPTAYWYFSIPETCVDGIQNQGESSPDRGGPCPLLDAHALSPAPILWARSFPVRDGSYNAVAYIQNSNENAGVRRVGYRMALYDTNNVLVAERSGTTFIMPGSVTPVFAGGINTGNRIAVRTYFIFTEDLQWERLVNTAREIAINDKELSELATTPRVTATAENTSVKDMTDVIFTATVFNTSGNAFATSQTVVPKIRAGEKISLVFTWPDPFTAPVSRVDVIPVSAPESAPAKTR